VYYYWAIFFGYKKIKIVENYYYYSGGLSAWICNSHLNQSLHRGKILVSEVDMVRYVHC